MKCQLACLVLFFSAALPAEAESQTMQNVKANGVIRMAHRDDAVPFSYVDSAGKPQGLTVEICVRIAERLRDQLGMKKLDISWSLVRSANRLKVVQESQVDMECGSTTNTPDRRQQVAFSMPFYLAGIKIMSHRALGVQSIEQLAGRKVAVSRGTTAARLLGANGAKRAANAQVLETEDHAEAWSLLSSGKVDAWITDDVLLAAYRARSSDPQLFSISERFLSVEPYGIVIRRQDSELVATVNQEITQLMRSGEFRQMYERWFQKPIPGKNVTLNLPMNQLLRAQLAAPSEKLPLTY